MWRAELPFCVVRQARGGPMTIEELTVQADTSSQVKNVVFYALKRIEKWFEDFKVKEARNVVFRERKVRDLTNQITERIKRVEYNQEQLKGSIQSNTANAQKTELMIGDLLRNHDGTTSDTPSPKIMEDIKKVIVQGRAQINKQVMEADARLRDD